MPITDLIKEGMQKLLSISKEGSITAGTGYQKPVMPEMKYQDTLTRYTTRQAKMTKVQAMALTDVRISRILYKMSADAVVGGLGITVESAPTDVVKKKAQTVIDDYMKVCEVDQKSKGWSKALLRDGDLYLENIINDNQVVRLKKLAAIITRSNMNAEGNYPENEPPYFQVHPQTQKKIKEFEAWQIIHIAWDQEDGEPYGRPMFEPAILTFDRLIASENNVIIRRQIRAGKRLLHTIGTAEKPTQWDRVAEYREYNKDTLEHPTDPIQDFWSNGSVTISEIGGDREIGEMNDIRYFEAMIAMQAGIPKAMLGREESINRDVLEEQEEDYYRVILDVNNSLEVGLRKAINLALLLANIDPLFLELSFNWGNKDRDDLSDKIVQAKDLQSFGFSFETIFHHINLADLDFEEEMERIRKQVQENVVPYGIGAKLDPTLSALIASISGATNNAQQSSAVANKLDQIAKQAQSATQPSGRVIPPKIIAGGGR